MPLKNKDVENIKRLVYQRPRNINELALALGKNWRTIDRYLNQIMAESGEIKCHTFREGTRGALKIVYWNNTDKIYASDVQEELFKQIEAGIDKSDFSPFEIYQYIDSNNKSAYYEPITNEVEYNYDFETLSKYFENAEEEILIFAGNLALIHLKDKAGKRMIDYIKDCINRGVFVKIISNINLIDLENVEIVNSLNTGLKDKMVDVRHSVHPIRAYIFDDSSIKMGEILSGRGKEGQVKETLSAFYEIKDEEWVGWMKKVFWKKFRGSIDVSKRIESLSTIKKKISKT